MPTATKCTTTQPSNICINQTAKVTVPRHQPVIGTAQATRPRPPPLSRAVLVTPLRLPTSATSLTPVVPASSPSAQVIEKVILKAVPRAGKTQSKLFTLRSIDSNTILSRDDLIAEIKRQLPGDIRREFDVGVASGNSAISIRTRADLSEVWSDMKKGRKVVLWCNGLKDSHLGPAAGGKRKRSHHEAALSDGSESDEEERETVSKPPKKKKKKASPEEREKQVQGFMEELKEKHSNFYTHAV